MTTEILPRLSHPRYRILQFAGEGGFGHVFEAVDANLLDTRVAIKQVYIKNEQERRDIINEVSILLNLSHANIPRIIDMFTEEHHHYIVMEFIDGLPLSQQEDVLSIEEVIDLGKQLLSVLEYIHNQSPPVVHRDVKPGNIIKNVSNNRAYLIDFGIAKRGNDDSIWALTKDYAPYEQYIGAETDMRTDIFSLSATLYVLATGTKPVDSPTRYQSIMAKTIDPLVKPPLLPAPLAQWIMRGLEIAPEQRWQSAREMQAALVHIERELPPHLRTWRPGRLRLHEERDWRDVTTVR